MRSREIGLKIKNKKILITGANGFIGRRLTDFLLELGAVVATFDIVPINGRRPDMAIMGDLRDRSLVYDTLAKIRPEIVYHLAAMKDRSIGLTDFQNLLDVNLIGSMNLFTAIKEVGSVRRIVVVATAEEYGHNPCPFKETMRELPVSAYSFSKMCMTRLCETLYNLHGMPFVMLRPTLAYGPGQAIDMFIPSLIDSLLKGQFFAMTPGEQSRDFVYIDDLVDALLKAAAIEEINGMIFNIGSGTPVQLSEVARMIGSMTGKEKLLKIGEKNYRCGEIMDYYVDTAKAKKLLGWKPITTLDVGLQMTIESFTE